MSRIFLFLLLACGAFGVEWKSYEEALKVQKESHKLIMLDVIRTNCHYCEDMDRDVFGDAMMSRWIEERFIPVKINLDHDVVPLGLRVSFTPSFFFVNHKGEIIKKIPGSWNIEDFQSMTKDLK